MTETDSNQEIQFEMTGATAGSPRSLLPPLENCAFLLDIDGTLLDLAPAPDQVVVPKGLRTSLRTLFERTSGALAFVSGRSIGDIDKIFAPAVFPAVGGHGAEMRLSPKEKACATSAQPMSKDLRKRFIALGELSKGILIEDKGYSIAIHYRLAPEAEKAIFAAVATIRGELSEAPLDVLPGKRVVEIKSSGFSKASGVHELMKHRPFEGRCPIFLGDDVTDDSVFAIMPDLKGLSFSVGRKAHGVAGQFSRPRDVRRWLAELAGQITTP